MKWVQISTEVWHRASDRSWVTLCGLPFLRRRHRVRKAFLGWGKNFVVKCARCAVVERARERRRG